MVEVTYLEPYARVVGGMGARPDVSSGRRGAYGGAFKVPEGFAKNSARQRVIDTPISEAAIVGAAAGAATWACRPVRRCSHRFHLLRYDMLTNYVATAALPRRPRDSDGGARARAAAGNVRGGRFHSQNPEAAFFIRRA